MRKSKNKSQLGRCRHTHAYFGIFRNIQTCSSIFRRNQTCSRIIQAYSGVFRTPVYSEQLVCSDPEAYSEHWNIQKPDIYQVVRQLHNWRNYWKNIIFSIP